VIASLHTALSASQQVQLTIRFRRLCRFVIGYFHRFCKLKAHDRRLAVTKPDTHVNLILTLPHPLSQTHTTPHPKPQVRSFWCQYTVCTGTKKEVHRAVAKLEETHREMAYPLRLSDNSLLKQLSLDARYRSILNLLTLSCRSG